MCGQKGQIRRDLPGPTADSGFQWAQERPRLVIVPEAWSSRSLLMSQTSPTEVGSRIKVRIGHSDALSRPRPGGWGRSLDKDRGR